MWSVCLLINGLVCVGKITMSRIKFVMLVSVIMCEMGTRAAQMPIPVKKPELSVNVNLPSYEPKKHAPYRQFFRLSFEPRPVPSYAVGNRNARIAAGLPTTSKRFIFFAHPELSVYRSKFIRLADGRGMERIDGIPGAYWYREKESINK